MTFDPPEDEGTAGSLEADVARPSPQSHGLRIFADRGRGSAADRRRRWRSSPGVPSPSRSFSARRRANSPTSAGWNRADLASWRADSLRQQPVVLDARTEDEFAVSHLPDAARIDPYRPLLRSAQGAAARAFRSWSTRRWDIAAPGWRTGWRHRAIPTCRISRGASSAGPTRSHPLVRQGAPTTEVHPYQPRWGLLLGSRPSNRRRRRSRNAPRLRNRRGVVRLLIAAAVPDVGGELPGAVGLAPETHDVLPRVGRLLIGGGQAVAAHQVADLPSVSTRMVVTSSPWSVPCRQKAPMASRPSIGWWSGGSSTASSAYISMSASASPRFDAATYRVTVASMARRAPGSWAAGRARSSREGQREHKCRSGGPKTCHFGVNLAIFPGVHGVGLPWQTVSSPSTWIFVARRSRNRSAVSVPSFRRSPGRSMQSHRDWLLGLTWLSLRLLRQ